MLSRYNWCGYDAAFDVTTGCWVVAAHGIVQLSRHGFLHMFSPQTRFAIASEVVSEQYENEALAINLDSGTYYSMNGASSKVWAMISNAEPAHAIVQAFNVGTSPSSEELATAVHDFLARLVAKHLIVLREPSDSPSTGTTPEAIAGAATDGAVPSFGLEVFTDMQDLLLLDPIHDVEAEGWPVARKADPKRR